MHRSVLLAALCCTVAPDVAAQPSPRPNTAVWFNSDHGISWEGIPDEQQKDLFNGGWRGHKETLYEGGLLVPGIIEWPAVIRAERRSSLPCVT